jgi:hypothetical protein
MTVENSKFPRSIHWRLILRDVVPTVLSCQEGFHSHEIGDLMQLYRTATIAAVLSGAILLTAPAARADKISDAMDKAASAYKDGKLTSTTKNLQLALGRLAKRLAKAYEPTLPEAPSGWKARKARSKGAAVGLYGFGISASRRYRQESGQGRADAQLIVDNPMVQAMAGMFANPAMAQQAGYEQESVNDQTALIKYDEDSKRGEAIILIAGRAFLKVSASNIGDKAVIMALAKGWKIGKIKEIAEIK